jgi:hypothetical protein
LSLKRLSNHRTDMMTQLVSQWAQWDDSLRILGDKNVKNYRMGPPVEFAFSWLRKVTEFYGLWLI